MDNIREYFDLFLINKSNKMRLENIKNDFMNFINLDKRFPIIIFGAGVITIYEILKILSVFGLKPKAVVDSDSNKWGKYIFDIEIMSLEQAKDLYGTEVNVFVSVRGRKNDMIQINNKLNVLGYKYIIQCTDWLRYREILELNDYNIMSDKNDTYLIDNYDNVNWLYNRLEDNYSKVVLEEIVHSRLIPYEHEYKYYETSYFEDSLFSKSAYKYIVDCGAYRGDTIKEFYEKKEVINISQKYYAFEMDPVNVEFLEKFIYNAYDFSESKIEIYPYAISDFNGEISIFADGSTGTHVTNDGDTIINAITLDSCLKNKPVTMIKMDIEGSEQLAIEGAKELIKLNRPVLVISLYHRNKDLWEIPKKIHDLVDSYVGILRHEGLFDYIYYAIPKELYNREI